MPTTDSGNEQVKNTAIFAGGTVLSRVLGLVRDITFTLIPGASRDAFLIAFRFPNMLRDLVGEGATNAAFVPVFSESLEKDSDEEFRELISAAMSMMILVLAGLTVVGLFVLPYILKSITLLQPLTGVAPPNQVEIDFVIMLSLWTFPYLFLIGMTVFAMAPLFTKGHYSTPSWTPALLNIAIIGSCLFLRNLFSDPAFALILGVWIGGIAQLVVQFIAMGRVTGVWKPNFKLGHPGIRNILFLLVPVLIGQSAGEVNKLVDTLFAASLAEGTVTALWYSNRLIQLPLSVFGIATAVAILPAISRAAARDDDAEIRLMLMQGLRRSCFLVLPAMVGLIVMREPIIQFLFQHGQFSPEDTARTASALVFYGFGLLSFVWVKVSVSGFYAVQNTVTPVVVASASMILNIMLNCVLVGPMGFQGLALATTISFTVNFVFLYFLLSERFGMLIDAEFITAILRICLATLMMAAVTYGVYVNIGRFVPETAPFALAARTLGPIAAAILAYWGLCAALDVPEFKEYAALLKRTPKK